MSSKDGSKEKDKKKTEVLHAEKEFYVLEITNLNRTIARLRTVCAELENENEECKKKYKTLDQDRNDVISYLKRSLSQKQEEIIDYTNRLEALQKEKRTEIQKYDTKILEMERKYTDMSSSLTAEITLLNGKLNSLEEFKLQKDCMIKKYLDLEETLKKEAERHLEKETIIENQSLIHKESMRLDVEKRLLELSINLQKDTQYRIAETTQNVVKENIALNNELNLIIVSWQKLFDQNEFLKSRLKTLSNEIDVSFETKDNLLRRHVIQKEIIDRLATKQQDMLSKYQTLKNCKLNESVLKKKIKEYDKIAQEAMGKYRKIENAYHSLNVQLAELKTAFEGLKLHNFRLEERIKESVMIIKNVIGLGVRRQKDPFSITEQDEYSTRINLLNTLLKLFDDVSLFRTGDIDSIEGSSKESIVASGWMRKVSSLHLQPCDSVPSIGNEIE
ncbi:cilia- and flagella-associated protein 157 isoform X2 [Halyomorpha halys]|uniref:cilia- and flagella-associated protein 157 isoform X2 n=1 Tax=Halyomorpha halys TaxID=286706 RepID=UPI0006D4E8AB|nr:cilia- and flagella-associated protein 157 [Halyomorpha halys]